MRKNKFKMSLVVFLGLWVAAKTLPRDGQTPAARNCATRDLVIDKLKTRKLVSIDILF